MSRRVFRLEIECENAAFDEAGAMTEIEALELVRNMAYDFDNQGNVLHDLIAQTGDSGSAVKDQTRAIDAIDAMLFRLKDGSQNDAAKPAPGYEIARILRNAGSQMEQGFIDGTLRDANGNKVGRFELADEQEAEAEIDRILARLDREIPEQEARVQRLMERYGLVKKEKL